MEQPGQSPNKYGGYLNYEKVEIPIPTKLKYKAFACVVFCDDRLWRWGYDYRKGSCGVGDGGGGHGPSVAYPAVSSRDEALVAAATHIKQIVTRDRNHPPAPSRLNAILAAIDTFISEHKPEQPPIKPLQTTYLFGWKYGNGEYQQYVHRREKTDNKIPAGYNKCAWWPIRDPAQGTRFKSIDACIDYWRAIAWEPALVESHIYDGFLQFFEDGPFGLKQIPVLTRQLSLFGGA